MGIGEWGDDQHDQCRKFFSSAKITTAKLVGERDPNELPTQIKCQICTKLQIRKENDEFTNREGGCYLYDGKSPLCYGYKYVHEFAKKLIDDKSPKLFHKIEECPVDTKCEEYDQSYCKADLLCSWDKKKGRCLSKTDSDEEEEDESNSAGLLVKQDTILGRNDLGLGNEVLEIDSEEESEEDDNSFNSGGFGGFSDLGGNFDLGGFGKLGKKEKVNDMTNNCKLNGDTWKCEQVDPLGKKCWVNDSTAKCEEVPKEHSL